MEKTKQKPGDKAAPGTIQIELQSVDQLFNSFDPSPFVEKDLDDDAEEYIVSSAAQFRRRVPLTLVLYLPAAQVGVVHERSIEKSVRNFFRYRLELVGQELKANFVQARTAALVGLIVLVICMSMVNVFPSTRGALLNGIAEGLVVMGWVAMWRPMELLLYEWWPIAKKLFLYRRLSHIQLSVCASSRVPEL